MYKKFTFQLKSIFIYAVWFCVWIFKQVSFYSMVRWVNNVQTEWELLRMKIKNWNHWKVSSEEKIMQKQEVNGIIEANAQPHPIPYNSN